MSPTRWQGRKVLSAQKLLGASALGGFCILVRDILDPDNVIQQIRYFTAPVSGKLDPGQPIRQQRYLQALSTIPSITIHYGNFLTKAKIRSLVNPSPGGPTHVEIWNTEAKGSDVNLATYLIHDAWRDFFDVALVLSQDTDLNEPVRIVRVAQRSRRRP